MGLSAELRLDDLVQEALRNSPEIRASEARAAASGYRIPQAKSLPDPMFMFGYQNDGFRRISYNESSDSQFMFTASQMFPFPGKLSIRGEMAEREFEGVQAQHESSRRKTVGRVKELYYDLFLAHRNIRLVREQAKLYAQIEDAALARYSSGAGMQQEVLMAQTEKYLLREREEMYRQKVQSIEAMLASVLGRTNGGPLGEPAEPSLTTLAGSADELVARAYEKSPEIKSREKMLVAAEAKVRIAQKEYYPDFTLTAGYAAKNKYYDDMWSLTTTINIPIYYRTKQRQAVYEAAAQVEEARNELGALRLMIASSVRDSYSMARTAEKLMELYREGLIPKTRQDFDASLASYSTGRTEAVTVITRLKNLIEYEQAYWTQLVEHEKAVARLESASALSVKEGRETLQ